MAGPRALRTLDGASYDLPLVVDGAVATELERRGAELSGGLWSARVVLERPDLVSAVHRDYLVAGADVITTASYQASVGGFVAAGASRAEAERLLRRCVELAVAARDEFWEGRAVGGPRVVQGSGSGTVARRRPLVATSVGPYGAVLANGSEYRGDDGLSVAELVAWHRPRLRALAAAGGDLVACETLPSLREAQALVEVLAELPGVSAWVSFSARDDRHVSDGTPVATCAAWLDFAPQVVAVGVNCVPGQWVTPLVAEIRSATDRPVVAYPNSGERWDATSRSCLPAENAVSIGDRAAAWLTQGVDLLGGCCRTGPRDVRAIADAVRRGCT